MTEFNKNEDRGSTPLSARAVLILNDASLIYECPRDKGYWVQFREDETRPETSREILSENYQ